ncbi:MAG: hypothetical protein HY220_00060 [Candidatus Sungbacteria bacterium]|uniref:Uncharacterized protein n=1 Tax=Candidatus Sungiibacteriota bacterium TaxID=2750080 RepID=A0A9D6LMN2_9BACT|nr:hypothetical protein [Candidatus Sungbacteria bacterium]
MDLKNFTYRNEVVTPREIFPDFNKTEFVEKFSRTPNRNLHQEVFNTALELWADDGYPEIIKKCSFHDQYKVFTGHCHQITPALGLVLKVRGIDHVAYLECYRVRPRTSSAQGSSEPQWQRVPPEEEPDEFNRNEFIAIGRIPYCCLEIKINDELLYLTGKHLRPINRIPNALLTPDCYRDMVGVFPHQLDHTKSGIYIKPIITEPFTWQKQTANKDPFPEFFRTYLYMTLEI